MGRVLGHIKGGARSHVDYGDKPKDGKRQRPNTIYHGDNLEILLRYVEDTSVDLIYLDPPFQSGRDYNLLFQREDGSRPPAQIKAFTDTWRWDSAASAAYHEVLSTGSRVGLVLESMKRLVDATPMLAYMSMMSLRLIELHRVLKPTGSLYLHCDTTASHYLKLVLDAVFGPERFMSEITWKRTTAHSDVKQGRLCYGDVKDVLLYYTKTSSYTFNPAYVPYDDKHLKKYANVDEQGRRFTLSDMTGPGGAAKGNPSYEIMGVTRYWRFSKETTKQLIAEGRIVQPRPGAVPRYKRFLDEMPGVSLQNLWSDIFPINSQAQERIGYPTQKPLALLQRIISVSSNEGDLVLDPFCGCGTAIHAALKLRRRWIGIDIAQQAIEIIEKRLADQFGDIVRSTYELVREPEDIDSARALALQDRHQFEKWAVRLVGGDSDSKAKGADHGIDGVLHFQEAPGAPVQRVLISVKSGHVTVRDVRDLVGTIGREKAAIGVLVMLNKPTAPMKAEASSADFYSTRHAHQPERYPRIQLLTIEDLLDGEMIRAPLTFRRRGPKRVTPQTEFKFTSARGAQR
jgi:DNA modification methylase